MAFYAKYADIFKASYTRNVFPFFICLPLFDSTAEDGQAWAAGQN